MCQCVPPVAAFGVVVAVVVVQTVCATLSVFTQQWVNCNFQLVTEFSFGLSKIKINFLSAIDREIVISDLASWDPNDNLDPLVDANGYVTIVTMLGMSLGLVAGGLACFCLVKTVQFKRAFINWMAGLIFADAMLVLIGLLIYELGVCPAIHDLGVSNMVMLVIEHFHIDCGFFGCRSVIEQAVDAQTRCTDQSRKPGAVLAVVQIVILVAAGFVVAAFVDLGEEQARMVPMGYGPGMPKGGPKGGGKGMQMQEYYGPRPGGPKPEAYGPGGPGPGGYRPGPPISGGDQSWGPGSPAVSSNLGQGAYRGPPGPPGSGGSQGYGPGPGPGYGRGGMPPPPPMGYGPR